MADEAKSPPHIQSGSDSPDRNTGRRSGTKKRQNLSSASLVEGIRNGDRSMLAKAITLIECSRQEDLTIAEQVVENCLPVPGTSIRVGITGVPGAGKSSLIEALGKYLITERNENVAVLAIDPSSRVSGGSILGDKTRMSFLSSSELAFIRPSPSRGIHGGIAQHTREAILLCEAAGYRNILIETVGVGQSETAVRDIVDFLLLVSFPGGGDELQGIKRGVMEIADLVAMNKADGDNLPAAERARTEVENVLHFMPASPTGWKPRAIACSAQTGRGVPDLWSSVTDFIVLTRANGWFERSRREQARRSIQHTLEHKLLQKLGSDPVVQERMSALEQRVIAGEITTLNAVRELLTLFASRVVAGQVD